MHTSGDNVPRRIVTADDVLKEFEAIVRTQGDRLNPGGEESTFVYTRSGEHCVAGQVLVNLGLPVPDEHSGFNRWPVDHLCNGAPSGDRFTPLTEVAEFSGGAVQLLLDAQVEADAGASWQRAIEQAIDRY